MEKLIKSDKLYNRIKWDETFDPLVVTIGYFDSVLNEIMWMPYNSWVPIDKGGDIPWHRVYYMKYSGEIFWDRKERYYNPDVSTKYGSLAGVTGQIIKMWKYSDKWTKIGAEQHSICDSNFKVISYNILFDNFDKKVNDLKPRLPIISNILKEEDADLIALQESPQSKPSCLCSTFALLKRGIYCNLQ